MRYGRLIGIGVAGLIAACEVARADDAAETACQAESNTGAVNACLAIVYANLDRDLTAAYKAGFKVIDQAALQPSLARDWRRA